MSHRTRPESVQEAREAAAHGITPPGPVAAVCGPLTDEGGASDDYDWGVCWPDDPDAVEEHPTEESARRVAALYRCARLVRRIPGPWMPVPEEDTQ